MKWGRLTDWLPERSQESPVLTRGVDSETVGEQQPVDPEGRTPAFTQIAKNPRRVLRLAPGFRVDRYVIIDHVGVGGMGLVYKAYDPVLDRSVALKVVYLEEGSEAEQPRGRIIREAQALAQLAHPNVVAVHDVGPFEDALFIAMEFVEGLTLSHWLGQTRRCQSEILRVMLDAGRGLHAAHEAGLIHRDFKPGNVTVAKDGRVRVVDFGLARAVATAKREAPDDPDPGESGAPAEPLPTAPQPAQADAHASDPAVWGRGNDEELPVPRSTLLSAPLTDGSRLGGTPGYMAPEQYQKTDLDARSDQFSFCIVLYEVLCGQPPFQGTTLKELRENVLAGQVVEPPKERRLPSWIRKIILRGLAPEREGRFASMGELLEALSNDPAKRRRKNMAVLTVALAMVFATLGGGYALWSKSQRCSFPDEELQGVWDRRAHLAAGKAFGNSGLSFAQEALTHVLQRLDAYAERYREAMVRSCQDTHVRGLYSPQVLDLRVACLRQRRAALAALAEQLATHVDTTVVENAGVAAMRLPPLDTCDNIQALKETRPRLQDPAQQARLDQARGDLEQVRALDRLGRYTEGLELATTVVKEIQSLGDPTLHSEALLMRAQLQQTNGQLAAAEQTLAQAAELSADAGSLESYAWACINRLEILANMAKNRADVDAYVEVAGHALKLSGNHARLRGAYLRARGALARTSGEYERARAFFQEAYATWRKELGDKHPDIAKVSNDLGVAAENLNDLDAAVKHFTRTLVLWRTALGDNHPHVARPLNNLGLVYNHMGLHEKARQHFQRALDIWRNAVGENHPSIAVPLLNLGLFMQQRGDYEQAANFYERARRVWEEALGPAHVNVAKALNNLGLIRDQEGKTNEAQQQFRKALQIWESQLGPEHPWVAIALINIATIEERQGRFDKAIRLYKRALAIRVRSTGETDPFAAEALYGLGTTYAALDRLEEARGDLERALAIRERLAGDPLDLAKARLALARVLWSLEGRRSDAVEMAHQAQQACQASETHLEKPCQEIAAWLAVRARGKGAE